MGVTYVFKRYEMIAGDGPGVYPEPAGDGDWVKAEDAIKREAELLAKIQELEGRITQSAALVAKAVALMSPPK
jgi:hypothetical protein